MKNKLIIQRLEHGTRALLLKSKEEEYEKFFDHKEPTHLTLPLNEWLLSLGVKPKKIIGQAVLPYEKVKVHPIIPLSEFGDVNKLKSPLWQYFNKNKLGAMLTLYLENKLEKEISNYSFEYMIGDLESDTGVTCISVNKEVIEAEVELFRSLSIPLKGIFIEQEVLCGMCSSDGLFGVFNFFQDKEKVVGLHVYHNDFLIGSRYLKMDVYQHKDLSLEMNLIMDSCKEFLGNIPINNYYVLSDDQEDLDEMREELGREKTKIIKGNNFSLHSVMKRG